MPNLKKVYDYAKTIQKHHSPPVSMHDEAMRSTISDTHTLIMCTEKYDPGKGTIGRFVDILICPLNKTYSSEVYHRVTAEQTARHQKTYIGICRVFTNTTQLEIMTRRIKLRNTKPLDLTQLRIIK